MNTLRCLTILKAAAERAARGGRVLKALLRLSALLLALAPPMARADGAGGGPPFRFCDGYYALCAASTCTPSGTTIQVNLPGGGTAPFPQADCSCPIFQGRALANVTGGNMQGSCNPPSPNKMPPSPTGLIWSLFSPEKDIPQELNGWSQIPEGIDAAPQQICPAARNLGDKSVNCFSFACDSPAYETSDVDGSPSPGGGIVPVVTCHCAIGESFAGTPVPAHTAFAIQAGQKDRAYCAKYPISLPFTLQ